MSRGCRVRALCVGGVSALMMLGTPAAAQLYQATVFADGLNNARGLAFDAEGALYIAEGGLYIANPSAPATGTAEGLAILGDTGSITRVFGGVQERIISGLPSLAAASGASTGPQGIAFYDGVGYFVTGLGANPAVREGDLGGGSLAMGLASIYSFAGASYTKIADLGTFELNEDPDGDGPDSNPFHLSGGPGGLFVTDAGGNSVIRVTPEGGLSQVATFANLPGDIDAVPTGIAYGPDGNIYVSQLTGFPFSPGISTIYSIDPATLERIEVATGLTTITDLVIDALGTIYVLQFAPDNEFGAGAGSIKRVNGDGSFTTIYDGLVAPTGLELGPDGAFYVTNFSPVGGIGQVLRIAAVPEPATWAMLIIGFATVGAAMRPRRMRLGFG